MNKVIQIESGEFGPKAVLTSAWSPEILSYLLDNGIVELELNTGKGWQGNDVSFLAELPQLLSLIIIDFIISSVEPIHFLHNLRKLKIFTYCKTEIKFAAFPQLEDCALEWRPKSTSLFDCLTLKKLFVNRYNGKDTSAFAKLINLESLAILNAPVRNLHGLETLKKLRFLRLANLRQLASLDGIEHLTNLEELNLDTCRAIASVNEVAALTSLQKLYLNNGGNIDSLKPLENMEQLVSVLFSESTNIVDGDLTPLLGLKNLNKISFQNRRHYSHRREEFGNAYFG